MSESKPTAHADQDRIERQSREEFSRSSAASEYRSHFNRLYPRWYVYNDVHFDGRLTSPRISIGLTSPRRLSQTDLTTDYGARTNIVLAERMVFGTDRRLVLTDDPTAEGLLRLIDDRLLGETVKQFVMEVHGSLEEGWDGYGPLYAREATRIGATMGLPEVHPRRRGPRLTGMPVAAAWPHAFRPEGYYLGHVSFDRVHLRGKAGRSVPRQSVVPGVYEYLYFLTATGQHARLLDILGREVDAAKEARHPALAAAERNPLDPSGMVLPLPVIDRDWLAWNCGCVRAIAEGIRTRRAFDGMPILADALQDAGCEDEVLLGHLRAHTDHTANCWALRLLTDPT
ncbi:MAG: hypothetical protein K8U57_27340 [Planctomycetes bacterium]|nr:hypothetical protein [Planctomycetota bacterium]